MSTIIVKDKITMDELVKLAKERFGDMVKVVVDIEKELMAVGGDLHADLEALLLEQDSKQESLWGINIYPDNKGDDFIEFDSMINIRPSQGNRSRGVEDAEIKKKIEYIARKLIKS